MTTRRAQRTLTVDTTPERAATGAVDKNLAVPLPVAKPTAQQRADALAYLTRRGHHDVAEILGLA